jgi:hypothetical protein
MHFVDHEIAQSGGPKHVWAAKEVPGVYDLGRTSDPFGLKARAGIGIFFAIAEESVAVPRRRLL